MSTERKIGGKDMTDMTLVDSRGMWLGVLEDATEKDKRKLASHGFEVHGSVATKQHTKGGE